MPVDDGLREFLFQVWADVLATTAVRYGAQDEHTKRMKRAAADLIWSASAKVSREERAEVIRRVPALLTLPAVSVATRPWLGTQTFASSFCSASSSTGIGLADFSG